MIVKGSVRDVPPPPLALGGLKTDTLAVPALAMSEAEICAINCVAETNVVCRSAPFQRTTDVLMKFVPVTINAKPAPPALAVLGLMLVKLGSGAGASVIVNDRAFDVPPPAPAALGGLKTVICAVPALAMSLVGICAVKRVLSINVVGRFTPFQRTAEVLMKFVPVTVSVKPAPPAVAELGFKLVKAGTGFGG